jgi:hypothetical protein
MRPFRVLLGPRTFIALGQSQRQELRQKLRQARARAEPKTRVTWFLNKRPYKVL